MRVLLVHPLFKWGTAPIPPNYFPLGLAYVASAARNSGHHVEVFDILAHQLSDREIQEQINHLEYDIVGITSLSAQYNETKWLSNLFKKHNPQAKIILGGALARYNYNEVLQTTDIDVCVHEWGERVFPILLENLDDFTSVNGISFVSDEKIVVNQSIGDSQNIDDFPLPAWDLFPMDIYLNIPKLGDGHADRSMSVITARGCPYRCKFCSRSLDKVSLRSIDSIIEEIEILKARYKVKVIDFEDELTMLSKRRTLQLCERIRPLNIRWKCSGRANKADPAVLKEMKKAGCFKIAYGLESGSPKMLKLMSKETTVEMNEAAVRATRRAGIMCAPLFIIGFPGETEETVDETIEFCKRSHIHPWIEFTMCTPLPGSAIYAEAVQKGLIEDTVAFLKELDGRFKLIVNMTELSDDELIRLKNKADTETRENYYAWRRKNPALFLKEYLFKLKRLRAYIKVWGWRSLLKELIERVKTNPGSLFRAEQ